MKVRTMTPDDANRAIDTVVLGFVGDPVTRWVWPHAHQYLTAMPRFVRAFGGAAFSEGGAFCSDDYSGAALWLRPGVHPDEERLNELMESTASPAARQAGGPIFEQMAKYHPKEPHWYLPLIGVDPAHQGRGHGDALMRYARAVRSRESASVPGVHQSAEYLPLPPPRVRGARHDTGRLLSHTRSDVATSPVRLNVWLSPPGAIDLLTRSG